MSDSVDTLLRQMPADGRTLSFLQELRNGTWQAAVRSGQFDYERGTGATAAAALGAAIAHADDDRVVPWRDIWQAGRSTETRPPKAETPTAPATEDADPFA